MMPDITAQQQVPTGTGCLLVSAAGHVQEAIYCPRHAGTVQEKVQAAHRGVLESSGNAGNLQTGEAPGFQCLPGAMTQEQFVPGS